MKNIVGASLSKLIQDIMSLMGDVTHQINQSPTCTSKHLPFTGGFESVFAAGLLICHGI